MGRTSTICYLGKETPLILVAPQAADTEKWGKVVRAANIKAG